MRLNVVLAEPRLTDYVHVVGIEGESLDVIHGGLSERAGDVWRVGMGKDRYANIFSAYIIKKLMFQFYYCWYSIYKCGSSQLIMSYNSAFNTHSFKKGFK